jgi:hypothetical protein
VLTTAVAAGAAELSPVGDEHSWWIGRVVDPFGHEWEIGKPIVPLAAELTIGTGRAGAARRTAGGDQLGGCPAPITEGSEARLPIPLTMH